MKALTSIAAFAILLTSAVAVHAGQCDTLRDRANAELAKLRQANADYQGWTAGHSDLCALPASYRRHVVVSELYKVRTAVRAALACKDGSNFNYDKNGVDNEGLTEKAVTAYGEVDQRCAAEKNNPHPVNQASSPARERPEKPAQPNDACVESRPINGDVCTNNDGLSVEVVSSCKQTVRVKTCIGVRGGKPHCGTVAIAPGGTSSFYACKPSGTYSAVIVR